MGAGVAACGTLGLFGIWTLEALNYSVHVVLRPQPWNTVSQICAYTLWALQLLCFARCQMVAPGCASEDWERDVQNGARSAVVCKRTGRLLPERALYVRRADGVVLGLDHYCSWLGTPIGLRNRKFFILFVGYSALFCAMGTWHSLYDLLCSLPDALLPVSSHGGGSDDAHQCRHVGLPDALREALQRMHPGAIAWEALASAHRGFGELLHLLDLSHGAGQLSYAVLLTLTVPANLIAAAVLGHLSWDHLQLVARNRTTLAPNDSRYDVGFSRNIRQVFGEQQLLWPLPTTPDIATTDGYTYPLNPSYRVQPSQRTLGARRANVRL